MNAQIQAVFRRRKMTYTLLILVVLGIYFFFVYHYEISFYGRTSVISESICLDWRKSDSR